jgi:hypothetical protein
MMCQAGYSGCDYLKTFFWQDSTLSVKQIIKEWREPDAKHYQVITENSAHFELIFFEASGDWNIQEISSN